MYRSFEDFIDFLVDLVRRDDRSILEPKNLRHHLDCFVVWSMGPGPVWSGEEGWKIAAAFGNKAPRSELGDRVFELLEKYARGEMGADV